MTAAPLLTEHCRRSPVPGGCPCWLRSVRLDGPATCAWCDVTADPADLGDPPPPLAPPAPACGGRGERRPVRPRGAGMSAGPPDDRGGAR